jgi:hypothetical protein
MTLQRSSTLESRLTNGTGGAVKQNHDLATSWFMKHATGRGDIRNRSDKQECAGQSTGQKITNLMNNEHEIASDCQRPNVMNRNSQKYTYALLVRSKERSRDILENALFVVFILSAVFAIWQFAAQAAPILGNQKISIHPPIRPQHVLAMNKPA